MASALDRIDPASLDRVQATEMLRALRSGSLLVGPEGERFALPESLVRFLTHVAQAVGHGQAVELVPEEETLTTQRAADALGVSRPFLIGLLEKGEIPFHWVGTHRRIASTDFQTYKERRDRERRAILDKLFEEIDVAGFYELGLDSELGREG